MIQQISVLFVALLLPAVNAFSQQAEPSEANTFADNWEFIGIAVEEPGYTVWGTSPLMDNDGKMHLYVARWSCELKVDPGWRSHSEIAHYVGTSPEGPFEFSDLALTGSQTETWDQYGMHNPTIHRIGDQYALLYIANDNPAQPPHPANQRIGMAIADSPYGPWKKVGKDGMILKPPDNPAYWNYQAGNGVNNPALLQHPDGGFFLYFKSKNGTHSAMGLAIAEHLTGPYVQLPFAVTANDRVIEDGYAFRYQGKFALLTTDNHGMIERGGGILWLSEDGIRFNSYEKGFHRINAYTQIDPVNVAIHYGPQGIPYSKFERPQVLLLDGKPAYLYAASGHHIYGGACTASYVLKYRGDVGTE